MQLQPGEKSILAYFSTDTSAENAAKTLKEKGYDNIQTDQISRFPNQNLYNRNNVNLSSMVLDNTTYDRSLGPLLAADPAVNGMGVGYDQPGGTSFLLTLVTVDNKVQEAVQVLKDHGATL